MSTSQHRPLPRSTVVAAMLTVVLVAGIALLSFITVDEFIDESRSVSSSHQRLTELTALISALEDAETANRGFVLTSQDDYLKQYEGALANWSVHYDRLLVALPDAERDRLIALRTTIDARLDRLRHGIALAVSDPARARSFIEEGDGKELMDRIHAGVRELQDLERSGIETRETGAINLAHLVKTTDFIGGTLAIVIVLASTWTISWNLGRRLAAERSVRDANARLEADVAERTAALAAANGRLRETAEDLERSNRELESFSYSVSHDLRAPLRVIEGLSGLAMRQAGERLDEHGRSTLETVIANTRRMRDLIDDLLAFSKLGFQEVVHERVDMEQMVADCWESLAPERGEREVTFMVQSLPACSGDPRLLRQVLLNLLSNAIKYTRPRSQARVEVMARKNDRLIEYVITDNGAGFDMAAAGKLFGVFQRLHGESEFEGTGIGLAICRRVVERHGGTIWAEAVEGSGATFHFSLPPWQPGATEGSALAAGL